MLKRSNVREVLIFFISVVTVSGCCVGVHVTGDEVPHPLPGVRADVGLRELHEDLVLGNLGVVD